MQSITCIVLHSRRDFDFNCELETLVPSWIRQSVKYVGVVGANAAKIEDAIDDLCLGDGSNSYFMVTVAHDKDETLDDALALAKTFSEQYSGAVQIVEI